MSDNNRGMFGASGTGDTSGYGGLERAQYNPASAQRPYGSYFDEIADELERAFPDFNDAIEKVVVDRGELTLHIKRERLFEVDDPQLDRSIFTVGDSKCPFDRICRRTAAQTTGPSIHRTIFDTTRDRPTSLIA